MRARSELLESYGNVSIWEIGQDRAEEISHFVFGVYYKRFSETYGWQGVEFEKMKTDDEATAPRSTVYAALAGDGRCIATVRATEKDGSLLPIERDFQLSTDTVSRRAGYLPNQIFEIGRLAKSDVVIRQSGLSKTEGMIAADTVIAWATRHISLRPGNMCFASIDAHVLALLRYRGFPFVAIGDTVDDYLGSPTVPVMLSMDECRDRMRAVAPESYEFYYLNRESVAA